LDPKIVEHIGLTKDTSHCQPTASRIRRSLFAVHQKHAKHAHLAPRQSYKFGIIHHLKAVSQNAECTMHRQSGPRRLPTHPSVKMQHPPFGTPQLPSNAILLNTMHPKHFRPETLDVKIAALRRGVAKTLSRATHFVLGVVAEPTPHAPHDVVFALSSPSHGEPSTIALQFR